MAPKDRRYAAWATLVAALHGEITEEELSALSWETARRLVDHCGITDPIEVAHIELTWRERQGSRQHAAPVSPPPPTPPQYAQQNDAPQPPLQQCAPEVEAPTRSPPPTAPAAAQPLHKVPPLKLSPSSNKRGGSASRTTPAKKPAQAQPQPKPEQTEQPAPQQQVPAPVAPQVEEASPPSRKSSTAARRTPQSDEAVCVEDMKDLFTKYASFAHGNPKEMDGSRFAKMCKECDLIDKDFTIREIDLLFQHCKVDPADHRLRYHTFRMALVPELAGKKRMSINDVVKKCNACGGGCISSPSLSRSGSNVTTKRVKVVEGGEPAH